MNQLDMKDRVAVVTGGAQGIGFAVAQRMLESGCAVALWDTSADHLVHAKQALSRLGVVSTAVVDVSDEEAVNEAARSSVEVHGRIDALVNSAGITGGNDVSWSISPALWRKVIDVNLVGTFLTCRAVVPHMLESGYGRIVNIASVAGKEGNPNASHYSASKAGVIGFTKSLGKELAKSNIMVNAVTPGAARTAIFDSMTQEHIEFMLSRMPMGRFLEVGEAAALIGWLCTSDCSFSTGAVFDLSGGRATY